MKLFNNLRVSQRVAYLTWDQNLGVGHIHSISDISPLRDLSGAAIRYSIKEAKSIDRCFKHGGPAVQIDPDNGTERVWRSANMVVVMPETVSEDVDPEATARTLLLHLRELKRRKTAGEQLDLTKDEQAADAYTRQKLAALERRVLVLEQLVRGLRAVSDDNGERISAFGNAILEDQIRKTPRKRRRQRRDLKLS